MSDLVLVELIGLTGTILTIIVVPLAVYVWKQRSKVIDQQTERADTYESEGIAAIEEIERENEELQLELESALEDRIEDRELIQSQQHSIRLLSESYARLAGGKAVKS